MTQTQLDICPLGRSRGYAADKELVTFHNETPCDGLDLCLRDSGEGAPKVVELHIMVHGGYAAARRYVAERWNR